MKSKKTINILIVFSVLLVTLIYFIIRAFHRQHLEGDDNIRWEQLESTFDYKGNPLTAKKCLKFINLG